MAEKRNPRPLPGDTPAKAPPPKNKKKPKGPNAAAVAAALASGPSSKKGYAWEAALADYLHVPYNAKTKLFFDAWATTEGGGGTNNPFNITVDYTGGSTGKLAGNTSGVLNFDTPLDGIKATAAFILRNDPQIASSLKVSDFQSAANALQAGHWAGSDPNYGNNIMSHFRNGTIRLGNNVPGGDLSPKAKAQVAAEAAALRAQSEAGNAAYVQATVDLAGQKKLAEQTAHISDPWVTVIKGKNGITFGQAIGVSAPKNTLQYAGQPVTKSDLSTIWNARYANIFEDFTGRVPTPSDIYSTISSGLTPYGLQAKLSQLPSFKNSPIYKKQATDINQVSQQILGSNASPRIVAQAIAEEWTQTQLEANLRKQPGYLDGPEFTNKSAAMKQTYQQIYGAPDAKATQTIKQAAANGWDANAFANYLRSQPEYTTSLEYQDNAVGLLDKLGLLFRTSPTFTPQKNGPGGGKGVPKSPLVPGGSPALDDVLKFQPGLSVPKPTALSTQQVRPQDQPVPAGATNG